MGDVIKMKQYLTKGEQYIYDWQYYNLGNFGETLASALMAADTENLERLRAGFPDEVDAFKKYAGEKGWWDRVQKKKELINDEVL
jgi:hypothetical protein